MGAVAMAANSLHAEISSKTALRGTSLIWHQTQHLLFPTATTLVGTSFAAVVDADQVESESVLATDDQPVVFAASLAEASVLPPPASPVAFPQQEI